MDAPEAQAESDTSAGGSAQARLNFQVEIPSILYLRIGSEGMTVDTVSFDVTDIPESQSSVKGEPGVVVEVGALVRGNRWVTLRADSSRGLRSGSNTMPFSTISWSGTGDFASSSGTFNGRTNQRIWRERGSGFRSGTFTFTYDNSYTYPPGTYSGQVTYTLSSQ